MLKGNKNNVYTVHYITLTDSYASTVVQARNKDDAVKKACVQMGFKECFSVTASYRRNKAEIKKLMVKTYGHHTGLE